MIIIQQRYIPTQAGARRVLALARGLSLGGVNVRIVYLAASQGLYCSEKIPNVSFEYWGDGLSRNNQVLGMISSVWKLLFCLPKDTIYYYGMNSVVMLLLMLVQRGRKYLHEFTEYPGFIFGGGFLGRVSRRTHNRFMMKCQKVFVISKRLKVYCIDNGIPKQKIEILNMFVDCTRFTGIKETDTERYVAYCGNGENFKDGVDNLIKAFAIVAQKKSDIKLKIVGHGPQNDWEIQCSLVRKYGLEERVNMLGKVSPDNIPYILLNAEALVLARPDNIQAAYGFPTKVGEYLATGRPAILTRVGELDDFLEDGKSCLFAAPDSPEEFADKLYWVLEHPDDAAIIGANGKKVAEMCFDNIHESNKVIEILNTFS